MDSNYEVVATTSVDIDEEADEKFSWKYFLRQFLVCSVIWMNYFMFGLCLGSPTVFIPQLRKEANSTDAITDDTASWLFSVGVYSSIPWVIILPVAAAYFGRKILHVLVIVNTVAAFTFFYLSSNVTEIMISQIMESASGAAGNTISLLVLTEYTTPKYRGIFLTCKAATMFWGIWVANAIGTFYHWKNIALLKVVLSIYPLVVVFFWPESPYWLASKGRLEKCAEAHRWLKGCDKSSEKELENIIESQKNMTTTRTSWNLKGICSKEFIKSTSLGFCVLSLVTFTGKVTCGLYALDIIKKMTSSESKAYTGMLIMDGFSVLGMYIGMISSKFFKRRPLFFSATLIGILSLWALGIYTYLMHLLVFDENVYISLALLSVYSIGVCCGPILFCTSLFGELLPLKFRALSMCILAIYDKILLGTVVKLLPLFVSTLGLHSAFFFFATTSTTALILLYKYMPETKDKTLVQIANEIKGNRLSEEKQIKRNTRCSTLLKAS